MDVIWQHLINIDPEEMRLSTDRMKMALARYARQSLLQWDDVSVSEIRYWYERLKDLFENEKPTDGVTEE